MRLAIEADSIKELQRATRALAVVFEVMRSDEDLSIPIAELAKRDGKVIDALQTLTNGSVPEDRTVGELLSVEGAPASSAGAENLP